jgi:hypothetical protein
MVDGYAELTLEARDPESPEHFHTRAFGLDVLTRDRDRVRLRVGDEGGRHVHVAFSVGPGPSTSLPATSVFADRSSIPAATGRCTSRIPRDVVEVWAFFRHGEGGATASKLSPEARARCSAGHTAAANRDAPFGLDTAGPGAGVTLNLS